MTSGPRRARAGDAGPCPWCREPILPGEPVYQYANGPVEHWECSFRQIVGSLAHLEGRCGCYDPGSSEGDPPELPVREAARRAVARWRELEAARPAGRLP